MCTEACASVADGIAVVACESSGNDPEDYEEDFQAEDGVERVPGDFDVRAGTEDGVEEQEERENALGFQFSMILRFGWNVRPGEEK